MKSTTVPAQVTTVEDKIAGNLNLSQLLLLAASVFVGFGLYIVIPPGMKFSIVKVVLCLLVMLVFASLAIKVKGRILALWIGTILRYNLRPRYYIFNKNDAYLRDSEVDTTDKTEKAEKSPTETKSRQPLFEIPMTKLVQLETAMADPTAQLAFETNKKGGLHVRITEIK
jgi:PrgI family protein